MVGDELVETVTIISFVADDPLVLGKDDLLGRDHVVVLPGRQRQLQCVPLGMDQRHHLASKVAFGAAQALLFGQPQH